MKKFAPYLVGALIGAGLTVLIAGSNAEQPTRGAQAPPVAHGNDVTLQPPAPLQGRDTPEAIAAEPEAPAAEAASDPKSEPEGRPSPPWVIKYEGPNLGYDAAAELVRSTITAKDLDALYENMFAPGLAAVKPQVDERQRKEIVSYLEVDAKRYLIPERIEIGLRGHLTEDAVTKSIRGQAAYMSEAMRYIRDHILSSEQASHLPKRWRE